MEIAEQYYRTFFKEGWAMVRFICVDTMQGDKWNEIDNGLKDILKIPFNYN